MALLFSYGMPAACAPVPEERWLAQLLRSAARAPPEPFKSLAGNHPVDVLLSKDAYELRTDAPGLSTDDVTVEVHEGVLTIVAGAHPPAKPEAPATSTRPALGTGAGPAPPQPSTSSPASESQQPQWKLLRRERTNGSTQRWARALLLPEDADVNGISVRLHLGVLTVRVPLCPPPPKAAPRKIPVNAGGERPASPAVQQPASPARSDKPSS